jgi:hypothetical protein
MMQRSVLCTPPQWLAWWGRLGRISHLKGGGLPIVQGVDTLLMELNDNGGVELTKMHSQWVE